MVRDRLAELKQEAGESDIVAVDVLVMLNSLCNCLIMVVVLVDK